MSFIDLYCEEFTASLASKEAAVGGAPALIGAIGMALCAMVGNITVGRRKYIGAEAVPDAEVEALLEKGKRLRDRILTLVDEDARVFEPLAQAVAISEDDSRREKFMEYALTKVCAAPLEMMGCCGAALELLSKLLERGGAVPVSDIGVGAVCCKAALIGASMNVYINSALLVDKGAARSIETTADTLLAKHSPIADKISEEVMRRIRLEGVSDGRII